MSITNLAKQAALQPDVMLQPHQKRVQGRLASGDNRLLLYHGLGTGKSLSSLAAAEGLGGDYAAVVPAALRPNYKKEIAKFTDSDPEVLSYTGVGMGKQPEKPLETLIFDEAHRLRNPNTAGSQAATDLANQAKNVMLLTGTPITNAPSDLASLASILNQDNITPEAFDRKFVGHKSVYPTWMDWLLGTRAGEESFVQNEDQLRQLFKNKVDYQPGKTPEGVQVNEKTVHVPLTAAQAKIQNSIRSGIPPEWAWKLDKEFPLSRDELRSLNSFLTGLRQSSLSTQPFRGDKDPLKAFQESGKLQKAFQDLQAELKNDPRKKGLIYSNYIDAGLSPYAAALEQAKIPYGLYHGGISAKNREQVLKDYNEGRLRALLLGPAAAEGISTKGTNLIQLLDPHWHESRSSQARGRGLRFDSHTGLPEDLKNVAVRRYISESQEPSFIMRLLGSTRQRTGDEILEALAARKEKLNDKFRKILQEEGSVDNSKLNTEVKTAAILPLVRGLVSQAVPAAKTVARSIASQAVPAAKTVASQAAPAARTVGKGVNLMTTPLSVRVAKQLPDQLRKPAIAAARTAQVGSLAYGPYASYRELQNQINNVADSLAKDKNPETIQQNRSNLTAAGRSLLLPTQLGGDDAATASKFRENHANTIFKKVLLPRLFSADPKNRNLFNHLYNIGVNGPLNAASGVFLSDRPGLLDQLEPQTKTKIIQDLLPVLVDKRSQTKKHLNAINVNGQPFNSMSIYYNLLKKQLQNKVNSVFQKNGFVDNNGISQLAKAAALCTWLERQAEDGGAWTRSEGKSESGGLNAKGRASLKAQGHDIKPPVTESHPRGERADRKSSFCARMGGMKQKQTSSETANDPNSRINKALRKWNC